MGNDLKTRGEWENEVTSLDPQSWSVSHFRHTHCIFQAYQIFRKVAGSNVAHISHRGPAVKGWFPGRYMVISPAIIGQKAGALTNKYWDMIWIDGDFLKWGYPELSSIWIELSLINIYKPSSYWGSISVVITNDHRVLEWLSQLFGLLQTLPTIIVWSGAKILVINLLPKLSTDSN